MNMHTNAGNVPPRLLLKPPEAAAMLAISPRMLWKLTDQRKLPCIRIGRAVRYDPADLYEWIREQKEAEKT